MYNPSLFSIAIQREMRWIKSQNHKSTVMITMQISIKCSNQICRQKLELKNCISFENRKKNTAWITLQSIFFTKFHSAKFTIMPGAIKYI